MEFGKLDEHSKINAQGTGLGLSICKRMIEKMGGEVKVDSIFGKGTIFTININTKGKILRKQIPDVSSSSDSVPDEAASNQVISVNNIGNSPSY